MNYFSGKSLPKSRQLSSLRHAVDRKNIVAAGLAKRCELQVAYAIGAAKPVDCMLRPAQRIYPYLKSLSTR